jgi:hypothetical protein
MQKLREEQAMSNNYERYSDYFEGISKEEVLNSRINYEYYYNFYKKQVNQVCPNKCELANYAVEICYSLYPNREKTFAWVISKEGLLENLKQTTILLPSRCNEPSEFEYLGRYLNLVNYNGENAGA